MKEDVRVQPQWIEELPAGITVCDAKGIITYMNDRAALIFQKSGGRELIGQSLLICHPEEAQKKILNLLETREPNAYTVEIKGVKALLYQTPWYENEEFMGYVEFILTLPAQMAQLDKIHWVKPARTTD